MIKIKYLGIIVFVIVLGFLVHSAIVIGNQQMMESFATTSVGGASAVAPASGIISSSVVPNSVVPNSITGVVNDPSMFTTTGTSVLGANPPGYIVTSSNLTTNAIDTSGNAGASANTPPPAVCDPKTLYSIKNVMQDKNGNIILRYMDTCGKYYTYEYTQTVNLQNLNTNTTAPASQPAAVTAASNQAAVNIDANAISSIISNALAMATSAQTTTPAPIVIPT